MIIKISLRLIVKLRSRWTTKLPKARRYALAVWLSRGNDPAPVQATGGWLEARDPAP